jgi:hypothetical protein
MINRMSGPTRLKPVTKLVPESGIRLRPPTGEMTVTALPQSEKFRGKSPAEIRQILLEAGAAHIAAFDEEISSHISNLVEGL